MRTRIQSIQYLTAIVLSFLVMAQPVDGEGKNPLGIVAFWPSNQAEPQLLWEHWKQRFPWAMVAKHGLVASEFYFASTLTEAQI